MVAQLRAAAGSRDVALLIEDRVAMARAAGADGVHLQDAAGYAEARRLLGPDANIGVSCGSRDAAMMLADAGADYICFGDFDEPAPTDETLDLVSWWSPLITVPCVAAPGRTAEHRRMLADAGADFVAAIAQTPST